VENGFEPSDEGGFALIFDLILSMAASENLKIFSLSCGGSFASPLDEASGLEGSVGPSADLGPRAHEVPRGSPIDDRVVECHPHCESVFQLG